MEAELQERRSGSANKTPRLRGLKIPRSGGTEVRTIEARVTYQNIGKMAWGSGPGVITGMVLECSRSVRRWSGVSEVGVEVHGYDTGPKKGILSRSGTNPLPHSPSTPIQAPSPSGHDPNIPVGFQPLPEPPFTFHPTF